MNLYSSELKNKALQLRSQGFTRKEIQQQLNFQVPPATFFGWCRGMEVDTHYKQRLAAMHLEHLKLARQKSLLVKRESRLKFLQSLEANNVPVVGVIDQFACAKIALAMLFICEGRKYTKKSHSAFSFSNSDKKLITLVLVLLRHCFPIDNSKFRCTVQCRDDQDIQELEKYWQEVTGIPKEQFYKTCKDSRTIGKVTKKINYKGVLRIDYFKTSVALELENLVVLLYNHLAS